MFIVFVSAASTFGNAAVSRISDRVSTISAKEQTIVAMDESFPDSVVSSMPAGTVSLDRSALYPGPDGVPGLAYVAGRLSVVRCSAAEAAELAVRLGAEFEVLTSSDGVFQCDRRLVPEAKELASLSFEEAVELARFERSGLDSAIVGQIARYRVPATIRSIGYPTEASPPAGTRIAFAHEAEGGPVKAIASQDGVSMISVTGTCLPGSIGTAARVFDAVGRAGVRVLLISQSSSGYSIGFCVHAEHETTANAAIEEEFAPELTAKTLDPVSAIGDLSILTLIGDGMRRTKGIAGRCFTQLARADANIVAIAQGSSERSISAVVSRARIDRGIRMVYQAFFDSSMPLDLVVVGCGNVGAALLSQISSQAGRLEGHGVGARVVAVANSERMIIAPDGIECSGFDRNGWRDRLNGEGRPFSLEELAALGPELTNPVLVDCTATEALPEAYPSFMLAGFHVVTPNKRGNAGSMARYLALKRLSLGHRRRYLYETTVGAGLPVIENLQNLLHAGDRLDSFCGILSGSLSYLFGRLEEGASFSATIQDAMAKGFTEPDPREDLSGADVARKVLIIAREAGLELELDDIELCGLVPADYLAMGRGEFIARLSELDDYFGSMCAKAAAEGTVLRFVGSIEAGKGRVGLRAVGPEHPLYAVKGGENALAFSTRYYSPVPLLLRGYGAGADVTAAGIFSDILRTLNWIREA